MKKIGLLSLALLLALGAVGGGLAYFSDTATLTTIFTAGEWELGGSPGFWKNWDRHDTYTETEILGFLAAIDVSSQWLVPDENENDVIDISDMQAVFDAGQGGTMEEKFLAQYLATRLDMEADRLWPDRKHDITAIDEHNYLALDYPSLATLSEIVHAIENKYTEESEHKATDKQFGIMKDVCEAVNELKI
jgi:predicted ribosomally synthesized peptide with SipW-like signal peptide